MKREEILKNAIENAKEKLKDAPEGNLVVRNQRGHLRYYQRLSRTPIKDLYLGKAEEQRIRALQEKEYYLGILMAAENELDALRKINKINDKATKFEQVYFSLPEIKRNLISPCYAADIEEAKQKIEKECKFWQKESLERKGVDKDLHLITLNGEKVRSKSELIIADRLKTSGVPYYYEGKYIFDGGGFNGYQVWFPDFQVLNKRTGDMFFWEHFGLMDNPEYCASSQFKLETYAKHGIIMGKNLIVTMESSTHTLNVEYVDRLIDEFLI